MRGTGAPAALFAVDYASRTPALRSIRLRECGEKRMLSRLRRLPAALLCSPALGGPRDRATVMLIPALGCPASRLCDERWAVMHARAGRIDTRP